MSASSNTLVVTLDRSAIPSKLPSNVRTVVDRLALLFRQIITDLAFDTEQVYYTLTVPFPKVLDDLDVFALAHILEDIHANSLKDIIIRVSTSKTTGASIAYEDGISVGSKIIAINCFPRRYSLLKAFDKLDHDWSDKEPFEGKIKSAFIARTKG